MYYNLPSWWRWYHWRLYVNLNTEKKETCEDNKAFIFNLTKNIIKRNKRSKSNKNAITNFEDSSNFIKFGSCDVFKLSGNCLNDDKSYADKCGCNDSNFDCQES